jgi:hypothetical protein
MPHLLLLLPLSAALAAAPAPPADCAAVLRDRVVDEASLVVYGLALREGLCYRLGPDGRTSGEPLSASELREVLAPRSMQGRAARAPVLPGENDARAAATGLPLVEITPLSLDMLFDHMAARASLAAPAADTAAAPPPPAAPRAEPWKEPGFDESWAGIQDGYAAPKSRARALAALSRRFSKDEDSATGLSEDAPEALRLLALELHEGRGGPAAAAELRRELALVSELSPEQKAAFAASLKSPRPVYAALSRSRAPHSVDARLYFKRLGALLAARGLTLPQFVADEDPEGRHAAEFFLRCHAYDLLIPRLNAHPDEASALAAWLFPDDTAPVRARAAQLEGLMTQLASQGRRTGALEGFFEGLEARAAAAPEPAARRVAAYAKVNEKLLPRSWKPRVAALAARLPAGLLESEGLAPVEPYDQWPEDRWNFVLHFASTDGYKAFLSNFRARGWTADGPDALLKDYDGGLTIRLEARLHPGDKEGFLRGAEAARYLADVRRELRDPSVQGVILRNHAQFRIAGLFDRRVTPGKLLLDGACRSAWDLRTLRRACPTCSFIVNTGTGYGRINEEAVAAVVEGLGRREEWSEIGEAWSRQMPRTAARIQGPWTPPFEQAVLLLDAHEKAAAAAAR